MTERATFIDHPRFAASPWNALHPLAFSRQANVRHLCELMGWLDPATVRQGHEANWETLSAFHDADYLAALRAASDSGQTSAADRGRYHFGTMENPVFAGLFERAAATVGCAIDAALVALAGPIAFHPAGGTHHGRRDQASGFCYFNDPVFAIRTLLAHDSGPVLYLDIDAHHGDGVETAFAGHDRVATLSIHEEGRWPYTGTTAESRGGNAFNIPVPRGLNDSEMAWLVEGPVADLAARIAPRAIVITAGADCLAGDPLSAMELSNRGFWHAVETACGYAPHRVVLGGGGYNPWTVTRGWAGLWARLADADVDAPLPAPAAALLASFESDLIDAEDVDPQWLSHIADRPSPGPVRDAVKQRGAAILA